MMSSRHDEMMQHANDAMDRAAGRFLTRHSILYIGLLALLDVHLHEEPGAAAYSMTRRPTAADS